MNKGVNLVTYELTPLQAALIEWGRLHPYGRIQDLVFQDGVPVQARIYLPDGTGTEMVLFDKIARQAGLLK